MIRAWAFLFLLLAAAPAFGRAGTRVVLNANGSSQAADNCNFPTAPLSNYDFLWGDCFQGSAPDMSRWYEGNIPGSNSSGREVTDQDHVRNGEFDEQMGACRQDAAQSTILLNANPSNGDTISIGSTSLTTITFVSGSAGANQVHIGVDANTTAASLQVVLAAAVGDLANYTWTVAANVVTGTWVHVGQFGFVTSNPTQIKSTTSNNPYCVGRMVSVMPLRDGQYCEFEQRNSYLTGFGNSTFFEGEYESNLNYPGRGDFPSGFRDEMDVMQSRGNPNLTLNLVLASAPTASTYMMLSAQAVDASNPQGCTVASATSACAIQFVSNGSVSACGATATGTGNNQNSVDISSGNTTMIATALTACLNKRTTGDFSGYKSTSATNTIAVAASDPATAVFSYSGVGGTFTSSQIYAPDYPAGVDLIYWTGPNNGSAYAGGKYPYNFTNWPAGWISLVRNPPNDGTETIRVGTGPGGASQNTLFSFGPGGTGTQIAVGATLGDTMDNLFSSMSQAGTGPLHSYNYAHITGTGSITVQTKNKSTFYFVETPGSTGTADFYQTEWNATQQTHTYGFQPTEGGGGSTFNGAAPSAGWNLYIDGRLWVAIPFPFGSTKAPGAAAGWPHGNISVKISGTAKDTSHLFTWWNPNPTRVYRYGCYIRDYYIHSSPSALLNTQVQNGTFTSVTQAAINTPFAVSSTSNTIGTGSKTFTVATGTNYSVGLWALISDSTGAGNTMAGLITAETATTLTINATKTTGSGTFSSWYIESGGGEEPFTPAGHYSETAGAWRNTAAPLLGFSGTTYWNDTNNPNYSTMAFSFGSNPADGDTVVYLNDFTATVTLVTNPANGESFSIGTTSASNIVNYTTSPTSCVAGAIQIQIKGTSALTATETQACFVQLGQSITPVNDFSNYVWTHSSNTVSGESSNFATTVLTTATPARFTLTNSQSSNAKTYTFKAAGGVCNGTTANVAIQGTAAGTATCFQAALQGQQSAGGLYVIPPDNAALVITYDKGGGAMTAATTGTSPPTRYEGNSLAQPGRACVSTGTGANSCVACFIPSIVRSGSYDVQIWQDYLAGLNTAATVTVTDHSGAHAQTPIDQHAGTSGWIDYGNFTFDAQKATAGSCSGQGVKFSGDRANGVLITNFVRVKP